MYTTRAWHWLVAASFLAAARCEQHPLKSDTRPNIVFILTDDQDLHMDSLDYMPNLQKLIVQEGTSYKNHYCTTAICCPSRVTLWTGKNAHNTNVTDVNPPYGLYLIFISSLVPILYKWLFPSGAYLAIKNCHHPPLPGL
jgi:N-acetylglucosamine-6-sulfatase